ncbi:MAG: protein kinase, partial [Thermoanaerobaculia bacterium]|nr:protein kinase [Thermoanaerobaculia bacterium]
MAARELGPYLLLRKLSEDALGEIYRAGQKSGDDVERVVLLYFFKAKRDDATWLAETATVGRRALKGLSSPFLGEVVDSGEEAGSAYLSYEYVSGVGLQELIRQARQSGAPVPLEVALHIVDRIAAGLLAAWEHESRMLHGFVVPQLVRLSNEGEVRLLGIEVASRLRRLLTDPELEAEVRSYLAPEVVPQSQAATTDDVYSLGAVLYSLATGEPLSPEDDPLVRVGEATTANGKPLPEEILDLLRTSLAPAQSRARLPEWRAELNDLVLSESYDATSFNLAVHLHQLFGERLEEESDAGIAPTSTAVASTRSGEPAAGEDASPQATDSARAADSAVGRAPVESIAGSLGESPAIPIETADDLDGPGAAPEGSDRRFLVAAALVVLLVAAGAAYFLTRSDEPTVEQAATSP